MVAKRGQNPVPLKQVDISGKPVAFREATARGRILLGAATLERIKKGRVEKGDAIALARAAGVMGAKRTPELVILCHPLRVESTRVDVKLGRGYAEVTATVSAHEKTGVEMEALTAVTAALLNIWDVTKQYEKDEHGQYPATSIVDVKVTRKVKRDESA
jgi:cyclic pyranopterin monophosphate synthase